MKKKLIKNTLLDDINDLQTEIIDYKIAIHILKRSNKTGILISSIVSLQNELKRVKKRLDELLFMQKCSQK